MREGAPKPLFGRKKAQKSQKKRHPFPSALRPPSSVLRPRQQSAISPPILRLLRLFAAIVFLYGQRRRRRSAPRLSVMSYWFDPNSQ